MKRETKGRLYRHSADIVTYGRTALGVATSIGILAGGNFLPKEVRFKSYGLFGAVATMGAMDKLDGYLARKAEENGVEITEKDKKKDPFQDKLFTHMIMGSLAIREYLDGNKLYAVGIATNQIVTAIRDHKMTKSREAAVKGANPSAISVNKWKTGVQNLAHAEAVAPFAKTPIGQAGVLATYSLSTAMGIIGYRKADKIHRGAETAYENWSPPDYDSFDI